MELPSPWTLAAVGAGRTALGASFFPVGVVLAYAAARTDGAAMAVLLSGGVLFAVALLATVVLLVAGGRSGGPARMTVAGLLVGSILSLFLQLALAVLVAAGWGAMARPHRTHWRRSTAREPSTPSSRRTLQQDFRKIPSSSSEELR